MLYSWSESKPDPTSQIIPDQTLKLGIFTEKKDISYRVNVARKKRNQGSGFMTFWYGSGSSDRSLWLTDQDADAGLAPGPAIFVSDLQDADKK